MLKRFVKDMRAKHFRGGEYHYLGCPSCGRGQGTRAGNVCYGLSTLHGPLANSCVGQRPAGIKVRQGIHDAGAGE